MMREAKAIERRLRQRLRPVIRASPALWAEYRRARRASRPSPVTILRGVFVVCAGGPILFGVVPVFIAKMLDDKGGLDLVLAGFCLPAIGAALLVADGVLRAIWLSAEHHLYQHLPIRDGAIVRLALRTTIAASIAWFLVGAWPFGFVAWRLKLSLAESLVALAFCLAQWIVIVAAGVAVARYWPKSWYSQVGAMLMLCGPVLLLYPSIALAARVADAVYIGTPGGWVAAAWMRGWLHANPWGWLGLLPALFMLVLFQKVCREWPARHFAAELPVLPLTAERESENEPDSVRPIFSCCEWFGWVLGNWEAEADFEEPSTDVVADGIRSRGMLEPGVLFGTNAFEGLCRRFLTSRERFAAEWLVGDWLAASNAGTGMAYLAVCAAALDAIAGLRFPCFGLLCFSLVVGLYTDRWRGFATVRCAGTVLPYYAAIPAGYAEIARVAFKLSLIHGAQMLPGLTLAAIHDHFVLGISAKRLCVEALVAMATFLAASILRPFFHLSMTSTLWAMPWRRAPWTIALLSLAMITVVGALADVALMASPANPLIFQAAFAVGGLMLLSAYLLGRLCLFLDGRGYFDLTSAPRPAMLDRHGQREALESRYCNCAAKRRRYGRFWWLPSRL